MNTTELPDVYSAAEIARAAGVRRKDVLDLAARGAIVSVVPDGRFFAQDEAVFAVRTLRGHARMAERPLFRPVHGFRREPGLPLALSGTLHAAVLAGIVFLTTLGIAKPEAQATARSRNDMRLVFLMSPGPGGGGGGGGRKQPAPPPPAQRKLARPMRSPMPVRSTPAKIDPPPVVRASQPPPVEPEPLPPIVAPVVAAADDPRDRAGIPWTPPKESPAVDSQGPGTGGGAGIGQGTGIAEGDGPGLGAGSGGGTGGGPYRPGAGITAPAIVREVKPDYTEEGRRRAIEGDVVVEIVVRADGTVGSVKLLQGLGAGLDQRAIEAVRQWRFSPARRFGTPVDVMVEVAMEFRLR